MPEFSLTLDEDQEQIKKWVHDFAESVVRSAAAEWDEKAAHAYVSQPEFSVRIALNQGTGQCVFWTTDLTHEYVHINADYST